MHKVNYFIWEDTLMSRPYGIFAHKSKYLVMQISSYVDLLEVFLSPSHPVFHYLLLCTETDWSNSKER